MDRMKSRIAVCAFVAAVSMPALFTGCAREAGDTTIGLPGGGVEVATIDGEPIPASLLLATANAYRLDVSQPEGRDEAMRRLTDFVVLAHVAEREDFAEDPRFAAQVALARLQGIAEASMHALQERANIDAGAIQATYDRQVKASGSLAWDFTQLLFDDEDAALRAEGDIMAGKPFSEVFDAHRAQASQARTFNAVNPAQVPAELAEALRALKPGETTRLPVHTRYGWHVVHLDATRPFTPPPLAAVEDGIRRSLARGFAETRLAELRENARVTRNAAALDSVTQPATAASPPSAADTADTAEDETRPGS
jgi:peptidyl-prolyl cis-trans isomerase C